MRDAARHTTVCPYRDGAARTPDPCRDYLLLRHGGPVRRDEDLGVWLVTGYEEVRLLLRHPAMSSAWQHGGGTPLHEKSGGIAVAENRAADMVGRWFMFRDGNDHDAARSLVAPLFSARSIAELRPYVLELVARLVPTGQGPLDIVADVAVPLSARVICRLLGLPAAVAPRLSGWADDLAALLVADYRPDVVARGRRTLTEISEVIDEAMVAGAAPAGSGLELLSSARARGTITSADVHATAALLVYAGFETTSTFIGKAVRALVHARAWPRLDEVRPDDLVEELLRFDTSVGQVARLALAEVTVAGHTIARGDLVLLMLGTADRDHRMFADPDRLAADRTAKRHLAFGYGVHYCLGAGLARMETAVVLSRLHALWRDAAVVAPPPARAGDGSPVLSHLWVRGEPRRAAAGF
ncbi:cytochrome P450 [Streptomyces sp. NPDC046853]|uniref:cytochrome P450 n=1 Tax=Streptomyces sp. NPDC046853 TaxID=3154920 RepID=UPI0033CB626C